MWLNASLGPLLETQQNATKKLEMTGKDASWILTSAVIIFTMQTGTKNPHFG